MVLAGCVFFIVYGCSFKWNEMNQNYDLCYVLEYMDLGGCFSSILATLFLFFFCVCLTSLATIALTISRHNHITFSSCLDAWWPGPSSCLLVISYRTSIIAYVLLFVYFFYKCQKGYAMQSANQDKKDWKPNFFGCSTKSAASYKQFEFDFLFHVCMQFPTTGWSMGAICCR